MELRVKLTYKNRYPLAALFIRGQEVTAWLQQMQLLQLNLAAADVYAVPGKKANSLWGCLVVPYPQQALPAITGNAEYCQLVHEQLFIAHYTTLYPVPDREELRKLLGPHLHFLHVDTGLVMLEQPIQWSEILLLPAMATEEVMVPAKGVYRPDTLRSMHIHVETPEETLTQFSEQAFPQQDKDLMKRPLRWWEKIKLLALKLLFKPGILSRTVAKIFGNASAGSAGNSGGMAAVSDKGYPWWHPYSWFEKLAQSYEALEERNKREVDKLLDMFRENPEEALRYAVPLDQGTGRSGGSFGAMELFRRWNSFSLNRGNSFSSGGGYFSMGIDQYQLLRSQYLQTAAELMQQGEYQKAAFIYMKLLSEYGLAAEALEKGGYYAEAAAIYLKHLNRQQDAARCYEKGNMPVQALDLYVQDNNYEKAGDICMRLGRADEGRHYYGLLAGRYTERKQYVLAAGVYRNLLDNQEAAEGVLLSGWEAGQKDALQCIGTYFSYVEDDAVLEQRIAVLYQSVTLQPQRYLFLKAMANLYQARPAAEETAKRIGYEIIAAHIDRNSDMAEELKRFNKFDKNLTKDILLYKQSKR